MTLPLSLSTGELTPEGWMSPTGNMEILLVFRSSAKSSTSYVLSSSAKYTIPGSVGLQFHHHQYMPFPVLNTVDLQAWNSALN